MVLRSGEGLGRGKVILGECERELQEIELKHGTLGGIHFTLRNMIITGKLIIERALMREESRGSHYRDEYPPETP
jgi:aspartate oxidase